jgi:hypothetical protein
LPPLRGALDFEQFSLAAVSVEPALCSRPSLRLRRLKIKLAPKGLGELEAKPANNEGR